MAAVITRGLPEQYLLMRLDPEGGTYITVKPATVAEQAMRDELWAKQSRTYHTSAPEAVEVKTESTFSQRRALEVFLTMVDCNLLWQDLDSKGSNIGDAAPLFKLGKKANGESYLAMDRPNFLEAWGRLPETVAEEIHEKVLLKNPQWDIFRG